MALFLVPEEDDKDKKETDDEKKKRIGFPDNDIWMLLQEYGCLESIPCLFENDINQE